MTNTVRMGSAAVLVATAMLTSGCGGGTGPKVVAARSEVAREAAAASSAAAAIAALSSKLAALTSTTPAAVPASTLSASPLPAPSATPVPSTSTGGLPAVPSGAALSSLLNTSSPPPAAPATTDVGALMSQANAALGGALSQVDVSKQCAAIPLAQVQALIKATVGPAANFPLQCGWKGTDLHVSLSPGDTDMHSYKALAGSGDHALPGLGDVAAWSEPVPGSTLPNVNAHKGSLTCYVEASDVALSTIPYTGKDPFFKITDADSLAYANNEAKLCADIFLVSKT